MQALTLDHAKGCLRDSPSVSTQRSTPGFRAGTAAMICRHPRGDVAGDGKTAAPA